MELEAMRDPFLGEALDGFDTVSGDHSATLERLSERIAGSATAGRAAARARATKLRESRIRGWSVAAAAVFLVAAVGGGVWLMRDGVISDTSKPTIAHRSGGYGSAELEEIMPPVTVIPNEAPAAEATDMSSVTLDSEEVRDFLDIAVTEPARDTVTTAAFRRHVHDALIVGSAVPGRMTLSFEVGADGRPQNIKAVETPDRLSEEAAREAIEIVKNGPNWPTEPSLKLITINL